MAKYPTYKIKICPICGEQAPYGWLKHKCIEHGQEYVEIEVRPTSNPQLAKETEEARKFYSEFQTHPDKQFDFEEEIYRVARICIYHPHEKKWGSERLVELFQDDIQREARILAGNINNEFGKLLDNEELEEMTAELCLSGSSAVLNAGFRKKDFSRSLVTQCIAKAKTDISKYLEYDRWGIQEQFHLYYKGE